MAHERLRNGRDVVRVLRRGRRDSRADVVMHVADRHDDDAARVAVVASRRVGGAVQRNRAKRVLRAAIAEVPLPRGVDVALVARGSTPSSSSRAVNEQLIALVEHVFCSDDETSGAADGSR